ncbi:hypothetical protein GIB67_042430, partial [Kingdonia uniflora]
NQSASKGFVALADEFRVKRNSGLFIQAVKVMGSMNKATTDAKVVLYKSYGWSELDILSAFRKSPTILRHSDQNIKATMSFLIDEVGYKPKDIAVKPVLLSYSLEKVLKPRNEVLNTLVSRGLINKKPEFQSVAVISKEKFLQNYVFREGVEAQESQFRKWMEKALTINAKAVPFYSSTYLRCLKLQQQLAQECIGNKIITLLILVQKELQNYFRLDQRTSSVQSRLTQFQKVEGEDSFASIHVAEAEANSYNINILKGAKKASSYPIYNGVEENCRLAVQTAQKMDGKGIFRSENGWGIKMAFLMHAFHGC